MTRERAVVVIQEHIAWLYNATRDGQAAQVKQALGVLAKAGEGAITDVSVTPEEHAATKLPVEDRNPAKRWIDFEKELETLINRHSMESLCGDTPDWILAGFACNTLAAFGENTMQRDSWYGFNQPDAKEVTTGSCEETGK